MFLVPGQTCLFCDNVDNPNICNSTVTCDKDEVHIFKQKCVRYQSHEIELTVDNNEMIPIDEALKEKQNSE